MPQAKDYKPVFRPEVYRLACERIAQAYLEDRRPRVVGFSGGKDSTLLLQLIWATIAGLPVERREKRIYVFGSGMWGKRADILCHI